MSPIRTSVAIAVAILLVGPPAADAKKHHAKNHGAKKHHVKKHHVYSAMSTCYSLRGVMRDGTYPRDRSIALNVQPLGSKIKLVGPRTFFGRRVFYVRDTMKWDGGLDFWHPLESRCVQWGPRTVRYVVLRRGRGR